MPCGGASVAVAAVSAAVAPERGAGGGGGVRRGGGASVAVAAVSAAVWPERVAAVGVAVAGAFGLRPGSWMCFLNWNRIQTEMTIPPAATANAGWKPNFARTQPATSGARNAPTLMPM